MPDSAKVAGPPSLAGAASEVDPPKPLDAARETTSHIEKEMTLLEEASYRAIYLTTGKSQGPEVRKDPDDYPDGVIPTFLEAQRRIHARISSLLNDMNALLEQL